MEWFMAGDILSRWYGVDQNKDISVTYFVVVVSLLFFPVIKMHLFGK